MFDELDELLKLGSIKEVQHHLEKINVAKVPRESALPLANIARRSGFHRLAFKIVNPIVRPKNKLKRTQATPGELCEYAMILLRLGVIEESRSILASPAAKECSERLLYLAFIYFAEWDYQSACDLLESYIALPDIDSYSKATARVNLAQSYVALEKPEDAIEVINKVVVEAKKLNWRLLHANALQNLADAYLDCKDFSKIHETLDEIRKLIGESHYRYNLYIKRVEACIKLPDVTMLRQLSDEAFKKREYELFRECNFIEAVATQNEDLFRKVYFGTPYYEYRKRILAIWGKPVDLGNSYLWDLNPKKKSNHVFDVLNGCVEGEIAQIKMGTTIHRLLTIFSENLYKTFKAEALFSYLFPDEFLQPTISTTKVYQIIQRTRRWLSTNHIGFSIGEDHGEYFLTSDKGYKLRISQQTYKPKNVGDQHIARLHEAMGEGAYFNIRNVKDILAVATASANRILKKAVEDGVLLKIGQGRSTEYVFSTQKVSKRSPP
ncbi:MAG: hypothetical protein A4S09_16120 [Proteobacteria bacterium SG_bin7]|nr:MAG: hypothetical protein A4S09_16120 [Proteobacteria bacterium SG_bin7]